MSDNTRYRAVTFGIKHHLKAFYQIISIGMDHISPALRVISFFFVLLTLSYAEFSYLAYSHDQMALEWANFAQRHPCYADVRCNLNLNNALLYNVPCVNFP